MEPEIEEPSRQQHGLSFIAFVHRDECPAAEWHRESGALHSFTVGLAECCPDAHPPACGMHPGTENRANPGNLFERKYWRFYKDKRPRENIRKIKAGKLLGPRHNEGCDLC